MILVFGSLNLDTIYELPELPAPGHTVIGMTAVVQPGGKGANQAVAAAKDGAAVAMAGAVGQDPTADTVLAGLLAAGVDVSRIARTGQLTGSAAICVDRHGQNQIAVASGANWAARADQVSDADLGPDTTLVLQMEVRAEETAALIRRARARGARIVLNLAPASPIAHDALRMVDWLVVNAEEAAWLGGQLGVAAEPAALRDELGVSVIGTRGAQGVSAAIPGEVLDQPAIPVAALDATGAGDCFIGVFAAALDRGVNVAQALRRANVAAALSVMRRGSQESMPTQADIDMAYRANRGES